MRRIGSGRPVRWRLFVVLGTLVWASGRHSSRVSARLQFILASRRDGDRTALASVVMSHSSAVLRGCSRICLLPGGVSLVADPTAFSMAGLRLVASATLSLVATSWGMIATDAVHAPACATTLIVSLGLLSTPLQVAVIVVGVGVLVASTRSCCQRTTELLIRPGQPGRWLMRHTAPYRAHSSDSWTVSTGTGDSRTTARRRSREVAVEAGAAVGPHHDEVRRSP